MGGVVGKVFPANNEHMIWGAYQVVFPGRGEAGPGGTIRHGLQHPPQNIDEVFQGKKKNKPPPALDTTKKKKKQGGGRKLPSHMRESMGGKGLSIHPSRIQRNMGAVNRRGITEESQSFQKRPGTFMKM